MRQVRTQARLAPGLRVVRRGHDHVQVGLYDGRRTLLPRTVTVERLLALMLDHQPPPDDPETQSVLDRLERQGLLARVPAPRAEDVQVAVLGGFGAVTAAVLPDLLARSGLSVTPSVHAADIVLVARVGEVDRERLDPLVRSRTSHLVVRLVDGGAVLGPFVVPGLTACVRCIDAHRCVADPDHVAVTTRYVRATSRARADGVDDVSDPALAAAAVSWAVRDIAAHVAGSEPATWSRTLTWGPEPTHRREEVWLRHPECGCSWAADSFGP